MKKIININLQQEPEDIVMEKNEVSGAIQYIMSESESLDFPEISECIIQDCNNDFNDLKEMMQSAKNMSGGIQSVINEVSKIDNIGPADTISGICCSIVFTPEEEKNNKPIWRPTSYPCLPDINRPKLIEPETLDLECARDLRKYCDILNIVTLYKDNLLLILKAMFQGGGVNHDHTCFKYKKIIVLLEGRYIEELNMMLPFGGWYNKETLEYGYDIISLCIYFLDDNFATVFTMLSEIAEEYYKRLRINNTSKSPRNIQVKSPISRFKIRRLFIKGAKKIHTSYYYTPYDFLFKVVEYWKLSNGEIEPIYYTIWQPWNSQIYHCQSLYPQPPYSLYKLDLIHKNKEAVILFVNNEMVADYRQEKEDPSQFVYTTCFGGLKNLLEVNVSCLSGRDVHLYYDLGSDDIQHIPEHIKRLQTHGVRDVKISFDNGKSAIASDDFMADPAKWGCIPELKYEIVSKNKYKIVPSGVKVEGEDKERMILLAPIIEKGDIIWIYGSSGSFKSYIGYSIAIALSVGNKNILKFNSGPRVKVGYFDAEMRPNNIKKRLNLIMKGFDCPSDKRPFDLYAVMDDSGANIGTDITAEEWQNAMQDSLKDLDVIILDNFQFLTDNSITAAIKTIYWFKKLSQQGKTIIVLDHTNKEGELQGSSSKIRAADLVIKIEPNKDIRNQVNISFEKIRDLSPQDTEPFDVEMLFEDGSFKMELVDDDNDDDEQVLSGRTLKIALAQNLKEKGIQVDLIKKLLKIAQSTVYKYLDERPKLTKNQRHQIECEAERLLKTIAS